MIVGEPLIRVVLVGIFLALVSFGLSRRVQAETGGEKLDRRQEGVFVLVTLRLLGFGCWLAVFLWLINPR
jgi:hypothetical protein